MTMRMLRGGCVIAIVGCMAACASLQVTSDSNPNFSVSNCHTYGWAGSFRPDRGAFPGFANPLNENRLRTAIAANLQSKSVQPAAEGATPDCMIGYGIGVHQVVRGYYPYPYPYAWGGWGWPYGYPGWGWGWEAPYVYHEGIIAVDIYDAKTRQPIWHASANQNIAGATGVAAESKINAAVAAMFAKYPT